MSGTSVPLQQNRRLCCLLAFICFFIAGVGSQVVGDSLPRAKRSVRTLIDTSVVGLSNATSAEGDTGVRDGPRGRHPGDKEPPRAAGVDPLFRGAAPLPMPTVGWQITGGPEVAAGAPASTQLLLNNRQSLAPTSPLVEGVLAGLGEKPSAPVQAPSIEPLPASLSPPKLDNAQSLAPTSPLVEGVLAPLGEESSAPVQAPSIEPLPAVLSPPKQLVNPVMSLGEPVSAPAPLESLSKTLASGPQPSSESVLTEDALAQEPVGPVIPRPSKTTPVSTPPSALVNTPGFARAEDATSTPPDGESGVVRGFASMRGPAVSVDQQTGSTSNHHSHLGTWFVVFVGVALAAGLLAAIGIKLLTMRRAKRQQEVLPLVQETEMTLL